MLNHTNCITIFSLAACILFGCNSIQEKQLGVHSFEAEPVASLLARADTLSGAILLDILEQLPSAQQDSFFLQRFLTLDERRADQEIQEILSSYKELQPDSRLLEGMESLFAGKALFRLGQLSDAECYLTYSLHCCKMLGQFALASIAAQAMSLIRRDQNRYKEALEYHEQFILFKDSVFYQEKQQLSKEISIRFTANQKEAQIESLKREHQLAVQRNSLAIVTLILSFCTIFFFYRKRSIRKARSLAQTNAQTEAHALSLEQVLEQQKSELEKHRIRLDDYALMLMEKNRQLAQKKEDAEKNSAPNGAPPQTNHDELFHQAILTEADWERFQHYFAQVHPGYISILRQRMPDLTPAELRLILLGKLGLSLKETSAILGISLDAVKKGRYRLRKKYNLDTDDFSNIIPYP
jgi:DNA-binding CsgD family transcriptional regulator